MSNSRTIVIESRLFNSQAFRKLKRVSHVTLMRFLQKRKMKEIKKNKRTNAWQITNNGEIVFTYKEALSLGLSRNQFRDAIDDLIAKGFLEVTYQGAGQGDSSTYKLCERWQAYGTDNFSAAPPRRKNRSKDRGWGKYNADKKRNASVLINTKPSADINTKASIIIINPVLITTPRYGTFHVPLD